MANDESALICDFVQYYHIYNITEYDINFIATLAAGLPSDSRSVMSISGLSIKPDTLILASMYDKISIIAWMLSKDGKTGTNRPESLVKQLTEKPKKDDILTFTSGEAFEQARARIIKGT